MSDFKSRGFTLIELLFVVAVGVLMLGGMAMVMQSSLASVTVVRAETNARQSVEFALEHIGRAVRKTQSVSLPTTAAPNQTDADPTKNTLEVSQDTTLDLNANGTFDKNEAPANRPVDFVVDAQGLMLMKYPVPGVNRVDNLILATNVLGYTVERTASTYTADTCINCIKVAICLKVVDGANRERRQPLCVKRQWVIGSDL